MRERIQRGGLMIDDTPSQAHACAESAGTAELDSNRQAVWLALEPLPALDRIVASHVAYVRSAVARFPVTPAHWREDLVQEVLIEAHRSRHSRLDVRALLFGITRHVVFRWNAKRHTERLVLAQIPRTEPMTLHGAEDERMERELRTAVRAAVDELPDLFREVFFRTEIEDIPMPNVTRALGIPLSTGYSRLYLARLRFLETFHRHLARHRTNKDDLL